MIKEIATIIIGVFALANTVWAITFIVFLTRYIIQKEEKNIIHFYFLERGNPHADGVMCFAWTVVIIVNIGSIIGKIIVHGV